MEKDQKEQKYKFTKEEREKILKETFKVGRLEDKCEKRSLEAIIDDVINAIKDDNDEKDCIRKYWFTKQIEEWKKDDNNKNKEPSNDELMEIVREDLKIRIANTMLALKQELKKHKDIKEEDIWFYCSDDNHYVILRHNNNDICQVSDFNFLWQHISLPYKPFFMKNPNDNNKLNGVCIYKHGDDKKKTKWIMACFKDDCTKPQCKITFQTNENNKITNVEIENKKDSNGKSTYTISLNNKTGKVAQITKKGEVDANKNYAEEIKQLLFEDKINKVLIDRIEDELDNQQKVVFDKIKEYLGVVKEEKKEEETKEEKKEEEIKEKEKEEKEENKDININDKSNNIINNETDNQNQNNNGKSGIANNECSQCLKSIWPFSLCCD